MTLRELIIQLLRAGLSEHEITLHPKTGLLMLRPDAVDKFMAAGPSPETVIAFKHWVRVLVPKEYLDALEPSPVHH